MNIREENNSFQRKQIALRIKKLRKFLKFTREEVAAYLGITREQYKDIEMGKEELLSEQLEKLDGLKVLKHEYQR